MAKRKDLRNGRESGSWKPHKWTIRRQREYLKHALAAAYSALCNDVGPYNAGIINAEVCARVRDAHNADAIHAAGYLTLGDAPREPSSPYEDEPKLPVSPGKPFLLVR